MTERMFGNVFERINRESRLPVFSCFSLQMGTDGSVTVSGCRTLRVCSETRILVDCDGRNVELCGEDLSMTAYEGDRFSVAGRILSVNLKYHDEKRTENAADK